MTKTTRTRLAFFTALIMLAISVLIAYSQIAYLSPMTPRGFYVVGVIFGLMCFAGLMARVIMGAEND